MATLRLRGLHQWQAEVRKRGYPSQTKTFETKMEAQAWARKIEHQMDSRQFEDKREADSTTLHEAFERYAIEITSQKKGVKQEVLLIKRLQKLPLALRPLSSIQGRDLAHYRDSRLKEVGRTTVRKELALFSHLFTVCIKDFCIPGLRNPASTLRKPTPDKGRDRRLMSGEYDLLIEACKSSQNIELVCMVDLAIETAARRGELLKVRWEDVDLNQRTARLLDTKNGDDRSIPLSTRAIAILRGLPRNIHGHVFGQINEGNHENLWKRAVQRARASYEKQCSDKGTKPDPSIMLDLHFHDLRHEATSRLFEQGLQIMEVSRITGHKTLSMLLKYTHLDIGKLAQKLG